MRLFKNGKIYMERNQFTESMIVEDNRIMKVGANEECAAKYTGTEVVDLEGKTVLPGLIDTHLHFLMTAEYLSLLPITDVTSMSELIQRTTRYIEENGLTSEDIVYTEGWNHTQFTDENRLPTREDLDKISTIVPIALVRVDRHMMSLNTAALHRFNIHKDTELEVGGEIQKDVNGNPTGVLTEGAVDLVRSQLPVKTVSEKKALLMDTMRLANSLGLTSMHTNDAKDENIFDTLKIYEDLDADGQLTIRFYQQIWFNNGKYMPDFLNSSYAFHQGTAWNKIGPVKLFIDGTLGSRTAALREPYADDPDNKGILTKSQEALNQEVAMAVDNGYQVIIHGIGDRGIETILNAFDQALDGKPNDLRLGVNHMQLTSGVDLIDRVAEKGYLTYVQPIFIDDDLPIVYDRMGTERAEGSYLFKSMKNKGIHQSFSSDAPIVSFNPFYNIQCAVTRNRLEHPAEQPYLSEEAMDIYEAIDAYTYEGAYASFEENEKGRLKEGFLADFIILEQDIFTVAKEKIKDTTVVSTYVNGKEVYKKEN
ncbi:amidohydrolase [Alkalibacterium iburiense]|uniref:Amidohydrolase n=1 Tax=Alkalibacterium iburiense TaxID=290589 RepID=A0ABN0X668_9LACT